MRIATRILWLLVALTLTTWGIAAQTEGTRNIAVIFDASGSMNAALGGSTRIEVARTTVIDVVGQLGPSTQTSLWAYGHRLPQDDPAASCQDIEQIIPLSTVDSDVYANTVSGINAIGYTPISNSLQQAANSLPPGENNSIILISDGEETCSGDPCAVARALVDGGVNLVVNTVGFAADEVTRQQLQCIAQVTGGVYYDAQDADALASSLQEATADQVGSVRIVDPAGNPLPDINFSLISAETGAEVGTFTGSGTVPVGGYAANIRIRDGETQPVVVEFNTTTDIVIEPVILGAIQLMDRDGNPVDDVRFRVTEAESATFIGTFLGLSNLSVGVYNVEVATILPEAFSNVTVVAGETTELVINTNIGTIRLVDVATGDVIDAPTFQVTSADGTYLGTHSAQFDVPPGDYTVAPRTQIPQQQVVTVGIGETVDVAISTEKGTIRLVDGATGDVLLEPLFNVTDVATGIYLGGQSGTYDVPPGDYVVEPRTQIRNPQTVTVVAGETVDVAISTSAGTIRLIDAATGDVLLEPLFNVTDVATGIYLGGQSGTYDVPPGEYLVEPRTQIRDPQTITVGAGETVDVAISTASGTIRLVDIETGEVLTEPLFNVTDVASNTYFGGQIGTYDVPPGEYLVEPRTQIRDPQTITVGAGETVDVAISTASGTIQLVSGGTMITEPLFNVTHVESGTYLGGQSGSYDVVPGVYNVEARRTDTADAFTVRVQVIDGAVTTVDYDTQTTNNPAP
jgi:Ca2+/Na+ antiporter